MSYSPARAALLMLWCEPQRPVSLSPLHCRSTTEWHEERQADFCASRETVGQMKERRDKLNQAAIEASRRNDQHAAAQLRQQAQQVGREIKAQETMAAESTFVVVNARHTRPDGFHLLPTVDLHYLTVEAALKRLTDAWDTIAKCPKAYGCPCLQPLITGRGRHSLDGVAKIKAAVIAWLEAQGVGYDLSEDGGQVIVRLMLS